MPVVLTLTKSDANKHLIERAFREEGNGSNAPIFKIVDIAKDLRSFIPKRNGGSTSNTVNDFARDIICESIQKYYFDGVR